VERLTAALHQLFGEQTQIDLVEVDRKGIELYKY
jgi:hypothetical protein